VHDVALVELHVSVEAPLPATIVGLALKVAVGLMLTVTLATVLVPPAPEQLSEYTVGTEIAPVTSVPPVAFAPDQPPVALQVVALVELHVRVVPPPPATLVGLAESTAVGAEDPVTVTVAVTGGLLPPGPEQAKAKAVFAVSPLMTWVPLTAFVPDHPFVPVQVVAPVALQVNVVLPPLATFVGLAAKVTTGGVLAATVTVTDTGALLPPSPVQISVNVVSEVSAPVGRAPLVASEPVQLPDATQAVELVELQVSCALSPLFTAVAEVLREAVGGSGAGVTGTEPEPPQAARPETTAAATMPRANRRKNLMT
jgi:hypothetical protein